MHGNVQRNAAVTALGRATQQQLAELDPSQPDPLPVSALTGSSIGRVAKVLLTFGVSDDYEKIEVFRDCQLLAHVVPDAQGAIQQFRDEDATPGLHRYDVQGVKGGVEISVRTTQVRTGVGSLLGRAWADAVCASPPS